MFSTDGFVIFRLIRRQPYSEMKRSGIERSMAGWRGCEIFDGKKIIPFGSGQNLMIHIFYEKKLHEKYDML